MNKKNDRLISVVVPVYNEENRLKYSLRDIKNYLLENFSDYEIIIVDDGSTDNTLTLATELANNDEKVTILKNSFNRGKGYSVKKGMQNAKHELVLFTDCDLATPIEELENFLKYLNYDILIASRNLDLSQIHVYQPFYRKILGRLFALIVQLTLFSGIKDTQCGFKLFKKHVVNEIFSFQTINGFCFDAEILYIAKKSQHSIKEMPVLWIDKKESKVHPIKHSLEMLKDVMKIRVNDLRGKYNSKCYKF